MAKVNIKTISQLVGVAPSTVSRVMSGNARKYRIAKATEEKILAAAKKLGFKPNYLAHSLNTNKTNTIGLVFANTIDQFLGSILEGVEARLRDTPYQLTIATCENSIELEKKEIQRMLYRQVDGIIIYPSSVGLTEHYTTEHLKQDAAKYTPYVVIGRKIDFDADHILFSDYQAGEMAASQFLEQGLRLFAALTLPIRCAANETRIQGFVETLEKNGVDSECIKIIAKGHDFDANDLEIIQNSDCIFSVNTGLLFDIIQDFYSDIDCCKYHFFSLGDTRFKKLFDYNLTTLSMPGREMGWQAAERILETMQGTKQEAVQETHINWSF